MFDLCEISLTKKEKRLENKKRKIRAFLTMAKINDEDRQKAGVDMKRRSVEDHYSMAKCEQVEAKRMRHGPSPTLDSSIVGSGGNFVPRVICNKHSLSVEELAAFRAQMRERQQAKIQKPVFYLTSPGCAAQINSAETQTSPLFLQDIQHLLLYSLMGDVAPYKPRWCQMIRRGKISHVVALVVEGLSIKTYLSHKEWFPKTAPLFDWAVEIFPPIQYNCCVAEELLCVPVSVSAKLNMEKRKVVDNSQNQSVVHRAFRSCFPFPPESVSSSSLTGSSKSRNSTRNGTSSTSSQPKCGANDAFPRTRLLLNPIVMLMEKYPLPVQGGSSEKYKDYVFTKDLYAEVTDNSPMFAIDCEMCLSENRESQLARATVVDEDLQVVYDTLVKPKHRIIDYLTQYSGITEPMLRHVTTTLADVQQRMREILPADAILCGQSLNSDLNAIKMFHPYVIDTSIIYNLSGNRHKKSGLKHLSQVFLQTTIQDDPGGHCSAEDSAATMKLVQHKLQNCLEYGDAVQGGFIPPPTTTAESTAESEYSVECSPGDGIPPLLQNKTGLVTSFYNHLKEKNRTVALVGSTEALAQCSLEEAGFGVAGNVTKFSTNSNKIVAQTVRHEAMRYHFTLGHMNLVKAHVEPQRQQSLFTKLDQRIAKVYRDLAQNGLFIVIFSGAVAEQEEGFHNGLCLIKLKT